MKGTDRIRPPRPILQWLPLFLADLGCQPAQEYVLTAGLHEEAARFWQLADEPLSAQQGRVPASGAAYFIPYGLVERDHVSVVHGVTLACLLPGLRGEWCRRTKGTAARAPEQRSRNSPSREKKERAPPRCESTSIFIVAARNDPDCTRIFSPRSSRTSMSPGSGGAMVTRPAARR